MGRHKLQFWFVSIGLSALFVWAAIISPTNQQALSNFGISREGLLSGARADRSRRFRLQPYEIVPLLLSFLVAALANACGVGGGAFFVPMFNVLLGFSLKGSTALSQAVVTGGACASFMYSSCKRHPEDDEQSLVDFDLALILTPMLLLGITAGVLINAVMPNWLITLLLVAVLAWLTTKTFLKGWQLRHSELEAQQIGDNAQVASDAHGDAGNQNVKPRVVSDSWNGEHVEEDVLTDAYNTTSSAGEENPVLASSTQSDREAFPVNPVLDDDDDVAHQQPAHLGLCIPWRAIQFVELTCLWAAFLGLQYGKISFSRCSWQYGALCGAQAVFSVITTVCAIFQAHSLRSTAQSSIESPLLSEQKPVVSHHSWPMFELVKCVVVVLLGGTVAGMLGFGGGMILGPLMLDMGIHPLVSSATSSVMVLFSASAATFSFAVADKLNYQYAFVYGGLCAVASIFGVAIISSSVRRSGKGSLIVFTLAFIIATGALMQAIFGGSAAIHDIRTGHHMSFQPLC